MDVGGRILQIEGCYNSHLPGSIPNKVYTVVRTWKDCVVVECETGHNMALESGKRQPRAHDVTLRKVATVSFHDHQGNAMEPIHVATRQQNNIGGGNFFATAATFATVCKSQTDLVMGEYGPSTIHYTTCYNDNDIDTQRYNIENLASISQIHFSQMNPMVLWSAARSKRKHELYVGANMFRRPAIGYGHSLHAIDLRSSRASFVWSQVDDEYMAENIQSISGILVDEHNPYSLYVSSCTSGKLYHVDARMPARTLYSWSLPGLSSHDKLRNSPSGIYGSGTLLTRPILGDLSWKYDINIPILGASKEPNSFGFHLYHKPSNLANFQTKNPEKMANHGIDPMGTFASSSFYALPTVSESLFTTGIAAFYHPMSSIVRNVDRLDYDFEPELALCVICANSDGHLYSYTMVACPEDMDGKARPVKGGPLGACAVPIPTLSAVKQPFPHDSSQTELHWKVSNTYPHSLDSKYESDYLPSTQYKVLDATSTSLKKKRIPKNDLVEINHPQPRFFMGPLNKPPPQRRHLMAHFPSQRPSKNVPVKRQYTVVQPSEGLQEIAQKLRQKKNTNETSMRQTKCVLPTSDDSSAYSL